MRQVRSSRMFKMSGTLIYFCSGAKKLLEEVHLPAFATSDRIGYDAHTHAFRESVTLWDIVETKAGGPFAAILAHDIFINCIYLSQVCVTGKSQSSAVQCNAQKIPPFITKDMIQRPDRFANPMCLLAR